MTVIDDTLLRQLKDSIADIESQPISTETSMFASPEDEKAFSRLERLCMVRERCASELIERLHKDGFEDSVCQHAVDRALKCGLVDDARFADLFIRGKVNAGKGARYIEIELRKRGIEIDGVVGWPFEYACSDEEQVQRAIDCLNAKPPTAKDVRSAAFRRLCSKGYASSIAQRAVSAWYNGSK